MCIFSLLFFVQLVLYDQLLDYSILLKARHDDLIHQLITLHNYALMLQYIAIQS